MTEALRKAQNRFLATLEVARRELAHLQRSRDHLAHKPLDPAWIESLEDNPEEADRLEAFASRFGRLQDTIGAKLIPRALEAVAEKPGTMLDNLARAERLGWIEDEAAWLQARELRNRLIHEYMTDPAQFASDLRNALANVPQLQASYEALMNLARKELQVNEDELTAYLNGGD